MSNEQLPPSAGGTPDEPTRPVPTGEEPGPPGSVLPASGVPAPERSADIVNPGVDAPGTGRSGPVFPEPDGPVAQPPGASPVGPTPPPDPPFSAPGGWAGAPAETPAPPVGSGAPGPWAVGPVATGPENPDPATAGMTGAGAPEHTGAASGGAPVPGALGSGPPPVGDSGVPTWAPPPGRGPDRARTARTAVLVAVAVGALVLGASAGFAAGRFGAGDNSRDGALAAQGLPAQRPYGEGGEEGLRGPERGLNRGAVAVGQVVSVDGSTFILQVSHGTVTVTTSGSTLIDGATGTQLSTLAGQVVLVRGSVNSDGTISATAVVTKSTDGTGEGRSDTGQSGTAGVGTGKNVVG